MVDSGVIRWQDRHFMVNQEFNVVDYAVCSLCSRRRKGKGIGRKKKKRGIGERG